MVAAFTSSVFWGIDNSLTGIWVQLSHAVLLDYLQYLGLLSKEEELGGCWGGQVGTQEQDR